MSNGEEGARRIARERRRQIQQEGWSIDHDDKLVDNELAWAALCYAAPEKVKMMRPGEDPDTVLLADPWPVKSSLVDKRRKGKRKVTRRQRIRDLEKAGALIAAEIDRLLRAEEAAKSDESPREES